MLRLVPGETWCIYTEIGSKQTSQYSLEVQYGLTSLLELTVQELVIGTQSIQGGKTAASHSWSHVRMAADCSGHVLSWNSKSDLSILTTMQESFEQKIKPHPQNISKN